MNQSKNNSNFHFWECFLHHFVIIFVVISSKLRRMKNPQNSVHYICSPLQPPKPVSHPHTIIPSAASSSFCMLFHQPSNNRHAPTPTASAQTIASGYTHFCLFSKINLKMLNEKWWKDILWSLLVKRQKCIYSIYKYVHISLYILYVRE